MWLIGYPNPNKMVQSLECIFLNIFTHIRTKLGWKKIFIIGLQNYLLSSMAVLAKRARIGGAHQLVVLKPNDEIFFWCTFCLHMCEKFQKTAFTTLFNFVRVRADYQPHVCRVSEFLTLYFLTEFCRRRKRFSSLLKYTVVN